MPGVGSHNINEKLRGIDTSQISDILSALDAELTAISALATTDGNIIVGNGTTWVAESGATARTSLGVAIGTNVQAWGAPLDDLNTTGASTADGEFLVATGAGAMAWESGATARTSLGVAIGTDVQAFGAVLDDLNTLDAATADGEFLVATGAGALAWEAGDTARTSLALQNNVFTGVTWATPSAEGTPGADQRTISLQATDENGDDMAAATAITIVVFADTGGAALGTGGTTALAAGTDGICTAVAGQTHFQCFTEADGDLDLVWTDTGTEAAYLGAILPNGKIEYSALIQNA